MWSMEYLGSETISLRWFGSAYRRSQLRAPPAVSPLSDSVVLCRIACRFRRSGPWLPGMSVLVLVAVWTSASPSPGPSQKCDPSLGGRRTGPM